MRGQFSGLRVPPFSGPAELGSPTWIPVVQSRPGWDRVLLPTRPNRSTGWVYLGEGGLQSARSFNRIQIDLAVRRLTVFDAGRRLGSWTVAVGAPGTPTPTGRTFLLASLAPVHPTYSPLILPLGTHSDTLTASGGGPGTVGLHGWPARLAGPGSVRPCDQPRLRPGSRRRAARAGPGPAGQLRHDHQLAPVTWVPRSETHVTSYSGSTA